MSSRWLRSWLYAKSSSLCPHWECQVLLPNLTLNLLQGNLNSYKSTQVCPKWSSWHSAHLFSSRCWHKSTKMTLLWQASCWLTLRLWRIIILPILMLWAKSRSRFWAVSVFEMGLTYTSVWGFLKWPVAGCPLFIILLESLFAVQDTSRLFRGCFCEEARKRFSWWRDQSPWQVITKLNHRCHLLHQSQSVKKHYKDRPLHFFSHTMTYGPNSSWLPKPKVKSLPCA